jgi:endogenous inhibitor of DNA gyrase (YacG/DUF329 family)
MSTPTPPFKETIVKCPTCGNDAVYGPSNPYRPFCREACKMIDLGAWATEAYRVPAPDTDPLSDLDEPDRR